MDFLVSTSNFASCVLRPGNFLAGFNGHPKQHPSLGSLSNGTKFLARSLLSTREKGHMNKGERTEKSASAAELAKGLASEAYAAASEKVQEKLDE